MIASTSTSEIAQRYTWSDYDLLGPIPISLENYTVKAFGSERRLRYMLDHLKAELDQKGSANWLLKAYWGRGKSTLVYNFCHEVNKECLINEPRALTGSPIFAIYCNRPQRPLDLLDYSVDNGIPIPWDGAGLVEDLVLERQTLFKESIRRMAIHLYQRILNEKPFLKKSIESQKADLYHGLMSSYSFADLPSQARSSVCTAISELLSPISTSNFLTSFFNLFGTPGRGLRDFDRFREFAALAGVKLLLAIDEAEDWRVVRSFRLDEYLLDLVASKQASVILILRTEIDRRLGVKTKINYYLIKGYFEHIDFAETDHAEIVEMTKGLLSLSRTDHGFELKPLTDGFLIEVAKRTKRGRVFNPRLFIRSLNNILELSQFWRRESVWIGKEMAGRREIDQILAKIYGEEELAEFQNRQKSEDVSFELAKKKQMISEIIRWMLTKEVSPLDRATFNTKKAMVARNYQLSSPSDLELLAFAENDSERNKIRLLISIMDGKKRIELEEPKSNLSNCRHLSWQFGFIMDKNGEPQDARKCLECGKTERY